MIGNAVAVKFAYALAKKISCDLADVDISKRSKKPGNIYTFNELLGVQLPLGALV
jgi:hypothetical protein